MIRIETDGASFFEENGVAGANRGNARFVNMQQRDGFFLIGIGNVDAAVAAPTALLENVDEAHAHFGGDQNIVADIQTADFACQPMQYGGFGTLYIVADQTKPNG
jgi:hypothetical protein